MEKTLDYALQPALVLGAAYLMGNTLAERSFAYKVALGGLLGKRVIHYSYPELDKKNALIAETIFLTYAAFYSAQHVRRYRPDLNWSIKKSGVICSAQWGLSAILSTRRELNNQVPAAGYAYVFDLSRGRASINDLLATIERISGQVAKKSFINDLSCKEKNSLRDWFARLEICRDFERNRQGFCKQIVRFLNQADDDPNFRKEFLGVVDGAAESCGDRVALSIIHIGIRWKLTQIDHSDLPALAEFLKKGVYAIDLLEKIARQNHGAEGDEIENYLAYPVKLKERLKLPIIIDFMIYGSDATESNIDDACKTVNDAINNPDTFHAFLIEDRTWVAALEAKYKTEIEVITNKRYEIYENQGEAAANDHYRNGLLDLTRRALP
ncbi:MAG: hypothetical protein KDK76_02920 [Chlamydiia bacterium]|nr:hypothetical protein [Chlamydiia bacterium]